MADQVDLRIRVRDLSGADIRRLTATIGGLASQISKIDKSSRSMAKAASGAFKDARRAADKATDSSKETDQAVEGVGRRTRRARRAARQYSEESRQAFRAEWANRQRRAISGVAKAYLIARRNARRYKAASDKSFERAGYSSLSAGESKDMGRSVLEATAGPVTKFANFQQAMANVKSVTNDTTASFAEQTDAVKAMGRSTLFTAKEAADGMFELAKAGFKANAQIQALPSTLDLAVAGTVELAQSAELVTNIMSGYGLTSDKTRQAADILTAAFTNSNTTLQTLGESMKYVGPIARNFDRSLADMAKLAAVLGNAGIDASQAGTTLRAMFMRLTAPVRRARKALSYLGVETADAAGDLRDPVMILKELDEAMKGKGLGSQQRVKLLKDIFGVEPGAGIAEIIDKLNEQPEGLTGYQDLADAIDRAAGASERVAKEQADTLIGDVRLLGSAWDDVAVAIGESMEPELRSLVQAFSRVAEPVSSFLREHRTLTKVLAFVAAGFGAVMVAVGTLAGVVASMTALWGMKQLAMWGVNMAASGMVKRMIILRTGIVALARSLWAFLIPIGIVVLKVLAVVAAAAAAYSIVFLLASFLSNGFSVGKAWDDYLNHINAVKDGMLDLAGTAKDKISGMAGKATVALGFDDLASPTSKPTQIQDTVVESPRAVDQEPVKQRAEVTVKVESERGTRVRPGRVERSRNSPEVKLIMPRQMTSAALASS